MGVNSLPKTVTRQHRDCDLNPGPSAPESSTLTTRLPSHSYRELSIQDVHIDGAVMSKVDKCLQGEGVLRTSTNNNVFYVSGG